ncbi:unnamed protein product [Trichogramma brassicae]|uniref:Uncharacterized protein n=1 Tax=Trichogramma brassicae TaxID=86971 RepID=A0A6H5IA89_9HYME|nr:unnamed protein product [Trichogramma brassicae]
MLFQFGYARHQQLVIDARNCSSLTPLHYALLRDNVRVSELLLRRGADPNSTDDKESAALHFICMSECGDDTTLRILFDVCDERKLLVGLDAQDFRGNTALHLALMRGHREKAELLLRRGCNPHLINSEGSTALHIISKISDNDIAELFFEICFDNNQIVQVNALDGFGLAPIHYAFELHNTSIADLLVRNGADLNLRDWTGRTPLHIVCQVDSNVIGESLARAFFEISEDHNQTVQIDAQDNEGLTPLQWAVARFLSDAVALLLDHGADLSSFVFPEEKHFHDAFDRSLDTSDVELTFHVALNVCSIIDSLEGKGYNLNNGDVKTIMINLSRYGFFQTSMESKNKEYKQCRERLDKLFESCRT